MSSANPITVSFPKPTLTIIATTTQAPTYSTISIAQRELNGNAASIHSNGGDGRNGHLSLTISPTDYLLVTNGIPFLPPANPPINPNHPVAATGPQIAEINRRHEQDQTVFQTYDATDKALRNQVIEAIPLVYIRALYNPVTGFGNVTTLALMTHLWTNYGKIQPSELNDNEARMTMMWQPPTPIEVLFTQLEDGVAFALVGGEPISDTATMRMGYNNVNATGMFTEACREWRQKADNTKTLASFQTFFSLADKDRRLNMTTGEAGYQGAVNRVTHNPPVRRPVPAPSAAPPATPTTRTRWTPGVNSNGNHYTYCWTHGCSRNINHTSETCMSKAEGHQDSATLTNKMGGSTKIWTAPTSITTSE